MPEGARGDDVPDAPWHVYLARCADGSLYCGVAKDVAARIATHNAGKGAKYTRGRRPVALVWTEPHATRSDALRRELRVKALPVAAKRRLAQASSSSRASRDAWPPSPSATSSGTAGT